MDHLSLKLIDPVDYLEQSIQLLVQLNPKIKKDYIENTIKNMATLSNYTCFGLFKNEALIGISSGWTTIRIYCGKQLELDNVIINNSYQSNGYGKWFMNEIEKWSIKNNYESIELNSYVNNSKSHKFYFNQGYKILGFHFQKVIS